jgi:hypothetical protein
MGSPSRGYFREQIAGKTTTKIRDPPGRNGRENDDVNRERLKSAAPMELEQRHIIKFPDLKGPKLDDVIMKRFNLHDQNACAMQDIIVLGIVGVVGIDGLGIVVVVILLVARTGELRRFWGSHVNHASVRRSISADPDSPHTIELGLPSPWHDAYCSQILFSPSFLSVIFARPYQGK